MFFVGLRMVAKGELFMEHNLREAGFFGNMEPEQITEKYGSPVYVYNEDEF